MFSAAAGMSACAPGWTEPSPPSRENRALLTVGRMTWLRNARRTAVACGVDIGSTNTKVLALTPDGGVVSQAARPTPREPHGLSIDVHALLREIDLMLAETCGETYEIHAICAAGIGEDGMLVDAGNRPLGPPLTWFDPRRQGIFQALRPALRRDDTLDVDGDPTHSIVGWSWSQDQPGAAAATSWVAVTDLASVIWTGRPFLSDTLASRTGAWRSCDRSWNGDRIELTLGSSELLPPVLSAGAVVGAAVCPELRSAGLLASDAIVVAGGHDHPIGGWGVDQLVPGAILDSMGTAEVAVVQSAGRRPSRPDSVDVAPGIRSDGTTLLRVEEITRNVTWARQDPAVARHIHDILSGSAAPLPVLRSGYFIPGQRGGGRPAYAPDAPLDPKARACAVLGALAEIGREAVGAVQESVCVLREVRLAGGWSRYPGWLEIKAAVNGFDTVPIAQPEVTAVGAALLAATARGWRPEPARAFGATSVPTGGANPGR